MKRAAVMAIAIGVAVTLAVGGGTAWFLASRVPSAQDAAHRYLDALSRGDLSTINDMRVFGAADDERMVADAFGGAESFISQPLIEDIETEDDGAASVKATVHIAGEQQHLNFGMSMVDGRWKLSQEALGTLRVQTTSAGLPLGDRVLIGGASAPVGEPIALLPAQYRVAAAPGDLLTGDATTVVLDEHVELSIDVRLSPTAATRAQEQLDLYADACAAPADSVPEHCGLRVPWAADLATLDEIAFRIQERPTVRIAADGQTFAATDGVIIATATGLARSGTQAIFTYRADDWALRGSIRFDGDEMVLSVD